MSYEFDLENVIKIGIDCVKYEESLCSRLGHEICYLLIEMSLLTVPHGSKALMSAH